MLVEALLATFVASLGLALFVRRQRWLQTAPARRSRIDARIRATEMPEPGLKSGVYGLVPGAKYRVIRAIADYYGGSFAVGDVLTFVKRDYLPYHGGHTLTFEPRVIYLQDDANADVLGRLDTYLEAL